MSKEKIEEMAKATMKHCKIDNQCGSCHWSTCNKCLSEVLYNAGYRKADEFAREIFEEIDKKVKASLTIYLEEINKEHIKDTPLYDRCSGIVFALRNTEDFLAELKKKYTGEKT